MSFKIWADESMTTEFAQSAGSLRHLGVVFQDNAPRDFVFYLGSKDANVKLQTVNNAGSAPITIAPIDTLPDHALSTAYALGDVCEPASGNGMIYQCTQAGTSGTRSPTWIASVGASVTDGNVIWRCMGKRQTVASVKLALSNADLTNTQGGASLAIAPEIVGGVAVAIHMRITPADALYDLLDKAQLRLQLNECQVVAKT